MFDETCNFENLSFSIERHNATMFEWIQNLMEVSFLRHQKNKIIERIAKLMKPESRTRKLIIY